MPVLHGPWAVGYPKRKAEVAGPVWVCVCLLFEDTLFVVSLKGGEPPFEVFTGVPIIWWTLGLCCKFIWEIAPRQG